MSKKNEEIIGLVEKLHEGKMLDNPKIKSLVDRGLRTNDWEPLREHLERFPFLEGLAEQNIARAQVEQLDNAFRPYPSREDGQQYLTGPLTMGYFNEFNDMWGINPEIILPLPCLTFGRPGSGKSQFQKRQIVQICSRPRDYNVIIPDLKGGEYRCLLPYCKRLRVLVGNNIFLNPLQVPENTHPYNHLNFFANVFVGENWLGTTSLSTLILILEDLYKAFGVYEGSRRYPSLVDLFMEVSRLLDKPKSFKDREILHLIQSRLIQYINYETFKCRVGIPYDVWRTEDLVLEVAAFPDNVYSFLVGFLSGLRYEYNMKMGMTSAKLKTLFVIDEARVLFRPRDTKTYGESYIGTAITRFRSAGIGTQISTQEPSSISDSLRSISFTKVCFPLSEGSDRSWIRESFTLNDAQVEYISKLPRFGKAIVSYGGYERAFLLAIPPFRIKRQLSDEEVERRMADFNREMQERIRSAQPQGSITSIESMPAHAAALLFNLGKSPFAKTSEMTEFSGFRSPDDVARALTWLSDHGYVERHEYRTSKRGRKSNYYPLTEKAYSFLGEKPPAGKGGFEHRLYQDIICRWLNENGVKAKIEAPIKKGSPKTCDVLARSGGQGLKAYEVTIHFGSLIDNLLEDLSAGADEVIVVTRDQEAMDKAIRMVSAEERLSPRLDRISFATMNDFFV